ncbi:Ankyrin repeat and SOCS box protein 16, partial [Galemys pyrenaicus]
EGAGAVPQSKGGSGQGNPVLSSCHRPDPRVSSMAEKALPSLRALRLQQEWLEWEDRRRAAAQQCRSHRCPPSTRARLMRLRHSCLDPAVHNALFSGDLQQVQALFQDEDAANMIVETVSNQLAWSAEQGFWVLIPKSKQTVPLTIAAARGYTDCARHLILQGAELDSRVGGRAALHEACAGAQSDCVRLLLTFGAKANVLSEEGTTPLHLCTAPHSLQCAKLLLEAGAIVNLAAGDSEVTPLHVAASRGLEEHVALYLKHGADVGLRTIQGETALNAACAGAEGPGSSQKHQAVVCQLLEAGADARVAGRKHHTPLHNACANGCGGLAELLLRHGACAGVRNGAGHTPMDCVLQAIQEDPNWEPEALFAVLLDYGAQPVHPEVCKKSQMLKHCANFPRALEVLLNAYPCVPCCDTWAEAVRPELWQEHEAFYSSARNMVNQPRRLQHLARLAVRTQLGCRCRQAAACLPLPPLLKDYLLLRVEGRIQ